MIPPAFEYHAPTELGAAVELLRQHGDEARVLAGGHSLLPMMKLRLAEPTHLVDLNGIDALRGIRDEGAHVVIGAMTTENELIASPLLRDKCPLIPEAARQIADPQVRNRGTIGGDIAHGDPANDHPAIALTLGAEFVLAGPAGERAVPADGFFVDAFMNGLEDGEILKSIRVPVASAGSGYAYCKLKRKTGDWATAAAAVQLTLDGDTCTAFSLGLTNVAATALVVKTAQALLMGKVIDDALVEQAAQQAMEACDPVEDLRGSVEYKTRMAGEMTRRAIRQALERARGA